MSTEATKTSEDSAKLLAKSVIESTRARAKKAHASLGVIRLE